MVMVAANGPGPADVVVSYPGVIDHVVLESAIRQLGKSVGFTPAGFAVRDAALAQHVSANGTDAEFKASGLVAGSGRLPVGAIIRSLPQWEHMRLVFILDPTYPFVGPTDVTAEGFAVRLVNRVATYEYDVERISGKAAPPGEATATGGVTRGPSTGLGDRGQAAQAPPSFLQQVLPAALIGLPGGLLAGWLLFGWRERRWRRRPAAGRGADAQTAGSTTQTTGSGHGTKTG
ncbi:MAG: hypothetical protein ABSD48_05790 [Armatimonadota bacterium]|jgi:hypothetical protein